MAGLPAGPGISDGSVPIHVRSRHQHPLGGFGNKRDYLIPAGTGAAALVTFPAGTPQATAAKAYAFC